MAADIFNEALAVLGEPAWRRNSIHHRPGFLRSEPATSGFSGSRALPGPLSSASAPPSTQPWESSMEFRVQFTGWRDFGENHDAPRLKALNPCSRLRTAAGARMTLSLLLWSPCNRRCVTRSWAERSRRCGSRSPVRIGRARRGPGGRQSVQPAPARPCRQRRPEAGSRGIAESTV